jgi:hypothetical protein
MRKEMLTKLAGSRPTEIYAKISAQHHRYTSYINMFCGCVLDLTGSI